MLCILCIYQKNICTKGWRNSSEGKICNLYFISDHIDIIGVAALIAAGLYQTFCGSIIGDFSAMAAKILVTPLTMCMNFLVMKLLIERI